MDAPEDVDSELIDVATELDRDIRKIPLGLSFEMLNQGDQNVRLDKQECTDLAFS